MDEDDYDSDSGSEISEGPSPEDICIPALNYLRKCCTMFSSMWTMPACPIFQGADRIKLTDQPKFVDPVIPNMDFDAFSKLYLPHNHLIEKGDVNKLDLSKSLGSPDSGLGAPSAGDTCGESKAPILNGEIPDKEKEIFKHELNIEEEVAPDAKSIDSGCCVVSKDSMRAGSAGQDSDKGFSTADTKESKVDESKAVLHKEASTSSLCKAQVSIAIRHNYLIANQCYHF